MSAAADSFTVYRDDGPLARAAGALLGRVVPASPFSLVVAGAAPLLALAAFTGDDAPVPVAGAAVAWAVLCGGTAGGRPAAGRLRWTLPPLVRLSEYAGLLWLAALAGESSLPAAFALLAAIAYRGYDLVYRLRIRGARPATWVSALSGGWDGRLAIGFTLFATGALPAGYFVWAAILAVAFVGESVAGWVVAGRDGAPGYDIGEDD